MRIFLSSSFRKAVFLGGSFAIVAFAWLLCGHAFVEYVLVRNGSLEGFQRAARWQPLNAFYPRVAGMALLRTDPAKAVAELERSSRTNPHAALTWVALARAYGLNGQFDKQHDAILRALASDPKNIDIEWDASLNLLQQQDIDGASSLIRDVIRNDPSKAAAAMHAIYAATGGDVPRTLQAVPPTALARVNFLRWLIEHKDVAGADIVWPYVASTRGNLQARDVAFYIDSLISRREVSRAQAVWSYIESTDPELQSRRQPGNLIVNGGFEQNLLNSGFGWRYDKTAGVAVMMDTTTFHTGTRSLAVQFELTNVADAGVYQLVPVQPNTRYAVRALTHSEELESANGVRLSVLDYYSGTTLMLGNEVLGSTSWQERSGDFVTGPETRLVKISIVRSPSVGIVRGRLWVDDFRMEPRR